jgi:hypothetical protein
VLAIYFWPPPPWLAVFLWEGAEVASAQSLRLRGIAGAGSNLKDNEISSEQAYGFVMPLTLNLWMLTRIADKNFDPLPNLH